MPVYQISYDIKTRHDFEYKPLYEALEKLKAQHIQESIWMLSDGASQKQVFDYFRPLVHKDDKLMVITVPKRPHWTVGFTGTRAFIDRHFPE